MMFMIFLIILVVVGVGHVKHQVGDRDDRSELLCDLEGRGYREGRSIRCAARGGF